MIADSFPTTPKMFQCRRNADEGKGAGRREGPRPDKVSLMTSAARNNRDDVVSASR